MSVPKLAGWRILLRHLILSVICPLKIYKDSASYKRI
nr:MAG TPA: hypothetical protein [Caudoviricetes sp.]